MTEGERDWCKDFLRREAVMRLLGLDTWAHMRSEWVAYRYMWMRSDPNMHIAIRKIKAELKEEGLE